MTSLYIGLLNANLYLIAQFHSHSSIDSTFADDQMLYNYPDHYRMTLMHANPLPNKKPSQYLRLLVYPGREEQRWQIWYNSTNRNVDGPNLRDSFRNKMYMEIAVGRIP